MPIGYDLTSGGWRFSQAVAAGDLHEALGVPPAATRIRIDVAVARLIDANPGLAREISRVGNVLTHRRHRAVYDATWAVSRAADDVIVSVAGEDPAGRLGAGGSTWRQACRLTAFDIDDIDAAVGPVGAASLPPAATDWVILRHLESVLPAAVEPDEPEGIAKLRSLVAGLRHGDRARAIRRIDRVLPHFLALQRLGEDVPWETVTDPVGPSAADTRPVPSPPPAAPAPAAEGGQWVALLLTLVCLAVGLVSSGSGRSVQRKDDFNERMRKIQEDMHRDFARTMEKVRREQEVQKLEASRTPWGDGLPGSPHGTGLFSPEARRLLLDGLGSGAAAGLPPARLDPSVWKHLFLPPGSEDDPADPGDGVRRPETSGSAVGPQSPPPGQEQIPRPSSGEQPGPRDAVPPEAVPPAGGG